MEKFIKLVILAFVGIIVGTFAIGLISGAGIGGFALNGVLPGFNSGYQYNHNGMYMNPQDPYMQQHMQQNPYMNMQGQMPYMNMQGQMPYMNMQGGMNMQGAMPGMNMQNMPMQGMNMQGGMNMQNMQMPDNNMQNGNMKGMGMMDMDMDMMNMPMM